MPLNNRYENADLVDKYVAENRHRGFVGGYWDELGRFQYQLMLQAGLLPTHFMLDAGCGALRGGRLFIDYLDPEHYYGTDLNQSLLDAGYHKELDTALRAKLPLNHLAAMAITEPAPFAIKFDFILAFSLFTHLPRNITQLGLARLAECLNPRPDEASKLLATFFICDTPDQVEKTHLDGIVSYKHKDPFHYTFDDIATMANRAGLRASLVEPFNHPRGQKLVQFITAREPD